MLDVVTLGESMVQLTPTRTGLLRYASHFERFVAGAESNVAIGLSRLGHRTGWIGRVGADELGACVVASIRGEGVDVSQVVYDEEAPTGVYFKERRHPGLTRVYYYRAGSAGSRLAPSNLDAAYIREARYLHLTGITPALSTSCRETVWRAIRIANEAQVPISFDPNLRRRLWAEEEARSVLLEMLACAHLVLASVEEAVFLTGEDDPEAAARILQDMGPGQVVVRLGADGALAIGESGALEYKPALAVDVVEAVGAGDAFNAGFLAGQLRRWDLAQSLHLGNILGGLATTVPGDVEGLPTWAEVQPYLGGEEMVDR